MNDATNEQQSQPRAPDGAAGAACDRGWEVKRRFWTDEEREVVRKQYRCQTAAEIGVMINRSVRSVHLCAHQLGLTQPQRFRHPGFRAFFDEHYAKGWTDTEIANEWGGTDRHAVGRLRRRLGLPMNRFHSHMRERVRRNTKRQLAKAGFATLAAVRSQAFRRYAREAGWPDDLRPRHVQMLDALWRIGPMTRRQLAYEIGMPWKGSRKSLVSNDPEGSYLAHLAKRGFVARANRANTIHGKGKGASTDVYFLTPMAVQIRLSNGGEHEQG